MGKDLRLEDLLHSLSQEGQQDSSGHFTLDINKASEKIRSFQLADPFQYCLRWLQGAVAGNARLFQWQSSPLAVDCLVEGMTLNAQRIPRLPGLLFESRASAAERHFSAGLNAIIQTKARAIHITSEKLRGTWRPGGYSQVELEESFHGVHIEMERSRGDVLSQLWHAANHHHVGSRAGSRTARDREQTLLHNHGACAPLILDIQTFPPDWELRYQPPFSPMRIFTSLFENLIQPPFVTENWWPPENGTPGFYPRPRNRAQTPGHQTLPPLCRIYVARPRYPHQHSFLYPVKDGVLLPCMEIFKGQPGVVFMADVSHLHTDLSGMRLVQDEAYRDFLEELKGIL